MNLLIKSLHPDFLVINLYLCIQEDEIHLGESEKHSCSRSNGHQSVMAKAHGIDLKELGKLEPRVDHRSHSKG